MYRTLKNGAVILVIRTNEIFETLTWNNKSRQSKESMYQVKNRSTEYNKGNKTAPGNVATTHTEDRHKQDT